MAFREVRVFEVREVLRLWLRGDGLRPISGLAGIDRKTVRRYFEIAEELGHRSGWRRGTADRPGAGTGDRAGSTGLTGGARRAGCSLCIVTSSWRGSSATA